MFYDIVPLSGYGDNVPETVIDQLDAYYRGLGSVYLLPPPEEQENPLNVNATRILGVPLYATGIWEIDIGNYGLARFLEGTWTQWMYTLNNMASGYGVGQTTPLGSVSPSQAQMALSVGKRRIADFKVAKEHNQRWHMRAPIGHYGKSVYWALQTVKDVPGMGIITGGKAVTSLEFANNALANLPVKIREFELKHSMLSDSIKAADRDLINLGINATELQAMTLTGYVMFSRPGQWSANPLGPWHQNYTGEGMVTGYLGDVFPYVGTPSEDSESIPSLVELVDAVIMSYPVLATWVPQGGTLTSKKSDFSQAVTERLSVLRTLMDEVDEMEKELALKRAKVEELSREPDPVQLPPPIVDTTPEPTVAPTPPPPPPSETTQSLPAPTTTNGGSLPAPEGTAGTTSKALPAPSPPMQYPPEAPSTVTLSPQVPQVTAERQAAGRKDLVRRIATTAAIGWLIRRALG